MNGPTPRGFPDFVCQVFVVQREQIAKGVPGLQRERAQAHGERAAHAQHRVGQQADELRAALFKGRIAGAVEGKTLGGKARVIRRQIARLQTIISEKQPKQALKGKG